MNLNEHVLNKHKQTLSLLILFHVNSFFLLIHQGSELQFPYLLYTMDHDMQNLSIF